MQLVTHAYRESAHQVAGTEEFRITSGSNFSFLNRDRKEIQTSVVTMKRSGTRVAAIETTGYEIDLEDADHLTILLPGSGHVEVTSGLGTYVALARDALAFGPSHRHTKVLPGLEGKTQGYLVKVPAPYSTHSETFWGAHDEAVTKSSKPNIPVKAEAISVLTGFLDYLIRDLSSPAPVLLRSSTTGMAEALLDEHIRALIEASIPSKPSLRSAKTIAKVRQAEEFMIENFSQPLTVNVIARAVGMGPRSLQSAFRAVRQQTPWEYLASARIREARFRILTADETETISMIALDCGITHLGRFSAAYRQQFGELPSQTMRKK